MAIAQRETVTSDAVYRTLAFLRLLFGDSVGVGVRLWDGRAYSHGRFTLSLNHPSALRAALTPPIDLSAGRAFVAGLIGIDGDIEAAIDAMLQATVWGGPLRAIRLAAALRHLPNDPLPDDALPSLHEAHLRERLHSRKRDRAAIGFHYDQPIAFYQTFLDEALTYSCAYFDDGVQTLDAAQTAKMDHVLRKVRLHAGERVLDIGCGWGGLVMRASSAFGADATGITLSRVQFDEARRRIGETGSSATVRLCDYRELGGERFDKIVSVGMFEHVGRANLRAYFKAAFEALRPGGLFLNHGIAHQDGTQRDGMARGFIGRFIFPDGELVRISDALKIAESVGFEIRDVENLREHYMRTLRTWVANLERNRDAAVAATDEQTYRAWRLYMAGSAQGFRVGRLGLYQTLLARPDENGHVEIPATRRDLYAQAPLGAGNAAAPLRSDCEVIRIR